MTNKAHITVLIAPLDWGLGHATRCVPLIRYFLGVGCKVIIAAEGIQKELLKKEFPSVGFVNIPGYRVKYTSLKRFFALKIALQIPKILTAIVLENIWLRKFIASNQINAIISDNRYGLYNCKVTSVFITHQLLIKAQSAFIEKILLKINYRFINKFSLCWVPDEEGFINLAGVLSHPNTLPAVKVQYVGCLSRLERQLQKIKFSVLIILSGPEPQRTSLEKAILKELKYFKENALFVRGLPGSSEQIMCGDNVTIKNHLGAEELQNAMNESEYIISRSGYTTVMDLCKLRKKSIMIPTPGQSEQEYLADYLHQQGWCIAVRQEDFSLTKYLEKAKIFDFRLPYLKMDGYKKILDGFINSLISDRES